MDGSMILSRLKSFHEYFIPPSLLYIIYIYKIIYCFISYWNSSYFRFIYFLPSLLSFKQDLNRIDEYIFALASIKFKVENEDKWFHSLKLKRFFSTPFPLFLEIIMQRSEESLSPSNNKTSKVEVWTSHPFNLIKLNLNSNLKQSNNLNKINNRRIKRRNKNSKETFQPSNCLSLSKKKHPSSNQLIINHLFSCD